MDDPLRTVGIKCNQMLNELKKSKPLLPDKTKPLSHCIIGVVLRTFATHTNIDAAKKH